MSLGLTYRGVDVFAPTDEDGNARTISEQQAQVLTTEYERLLSALVLSTNAAVIKGTLAELNAVVGSFANGDVGLVITDATEANRGVYKKVSGAWVRQSALPQDLAEAAKDGAVLAQAAAEAAKATAQTAASAAAVSQTQAQAARTGAEAARDIAAGYASDAVSQGNVPIYATVAGMPALFIPLGINAISINGYFAAGDGGGWPLAVEVANSGILQPWQFLTNVGSRRWQLQAYIVDPAMFGMRADGSNILTPWANAYAYAALTPGKPKPIEFRVPGSYRLEGILTLAKTGIRHRAYPGVRIYRTPGVFATIAAQGDFNEFVGFTFDWGWTIANDAADAVLGYRGAIIYNTMNNGLIQGNTFVNACGNHIISNGTQRNGKQFGGDFDDSSGSYDPSLGPTVAYTTGWSCFNNRILDNEFRNSYYGAIINAWNTGLIARGNRIYDTGAEAFTLDEYSSRCEFSGNYCYNIAMKDGRGGGVGAIGIDSGYNNRIVSNVFERINWIGGFTAGVHLLGIENRSIDNIIMGNVFLNCEGPGIFLDNDVATEASRILPAGTPTAPQRNLIVGNSFTNCGRFTSFLSSLPGSGKPSGVAIYVRGKTGSAASNTFRGNRLNGDAFLDAPSIAGYSNDPTNPNSTDSDHQSAEAWAPFDGTINSQGGAFGSVTNKDCAYRRVGKTIDFRARFTTASLGGAGGAIQVYAPANSKGSSAAIVRSPTDGEVLQAFIEPGGAFYSIRTLTNTNPVLAAGKTYFFEGRLEAA